MSIEGSIVMVTQLLGIEEGRHWSLWRVVKTSENHCSLCGDLAHTISDYRQTVHTVFAFCGAFF